MSKPQSAYVSSLKRVSAIYGGSTGSPSASSAVPNKKKRQSMSTCSTTAVTDSVRSSDHSTSRATVFVDDSLTLPETSPRRSFSSQIPSARGQEALFTASSGSKSGIGKVPVLSARSESVESHSAMRGRAGSGRSSVGLIDTLLTHASTWDEDGASTGDLVTADSFGVLPPARNSQSDAVLSAGSLATPAMAPHRPMSLPPPSMPRLSSRHSSLTSRPRLRQTTTGSDDEDEDVDSSRHHRRTDARLRNEMSDEDSADTATPRVIDVGAILVPVPHEAGAARTSHGGGGGADGPVTYVDARSSSGEDDHDNNDDAESTESLPLQIVPIPFTGIVHSPLHAPQTLPRRSSTASTPTRTLDSGSTAVHFSGTRSEGVLSPVPYAVRLTMDNSDLVDPCTETSGAGASVRASASGRLMWATTASVDHAASLVHFDTDSAASADRLASHYMPVNARRLTQSGSSWSAGAGAGVGAAGPTAFSPASSLAASGASTTAPFSSNLPWAQARASAGGGGTGSMSGTGLTSSFSGALPSSRYLHPTRPNAGTPPLHGPSDAHVVGTPMESLTAADHRLSHPLPRHERTASGEPLDQATLATPGSTTATYSISTEISELDALRSQVLRELRECKEQMRRQQQELQTLRNVACAGRKPLWETLSDSASVHTTGLSGSLSLVYSTAGAREPRGTQVWSPSRHISPLPWLATDATQQAQAQAPPLPPSAPPTVPAPPPSPHAAGAHVESSGSLNASGMAPPGTVFTPRALSLGASAGVGDAVLSMAELEAFERRMVHLLLNEHSAFGASQPVPTGFIPGLDPSSASTSAAASPHAIRSPTSPFTSQPSLDVSGELRTQKSVAELPVILARGINDFSTLELLLSNTAVRPVALKPARERWAAFKRVFALGEEYYTARSLVARAQFQRESELLTSNTANAASSNTALTAAARAFGGGGASPNMWAAEPTTGSFASVLPGYPQTPGRSGSRSPNLASSSSSQSWRHPRVQSPPSLVALTAFVRKVEKLKDKEVIAQLMSPQATTSSQRAL